VLESPGSRAPSPTAQVGPGGVGAPLRTARPGKLTGSPPSMLRKTSFGRCRIASSSRSATCATRSNTGSRVATSASPWSGRSDRHVFAAQSERPAGNRSWSRRPRSGQLQLSVVLVVRQVSPIGPIRLAASGLGQSTTDEVRRSHDRDVQPGPCCRERVADAVAVGPDHV